MHKQTFRSLSLAALVGAMPSLALANDACSVPGVTVITDPAGDAGVDLYNASPVNPSALPQQPPDVVVPVPAPGTDILSVSAAEPSGSQLVWTMKVDDLSTPPPSMAWIVRFQTDEPPENGDDDYFVAMTVTPDSDAQGVTTKFVYGTTGGSANVPVYGSTPPRVFRPMGELENGSTMNPDGTITLVLDKSKLPGMGDGVQLTNIAASVRIVSPNDANAGEFTNPSNASILDVAGTADSSYTLQGAACKGKSGGGVLGAGAFGFFTLLPLFGAGFFRRRKRN